MRKKSIKSITKEFNFNYSDNKITCLLGDNKIIIKLEHTLEVGHFDDNYKFIPELFFDYLTDEYYKNNLSLLYNSGYNQYCNFYLMFNSDYTSPIWNKSYNIIGNAFKYEPTINNYSIFQINNQLIKMIKLYFSYAKFKLNYTKKLISKFYYLINENYIEKYKSYYDYINLEDNLKKNSIVSDIIKIIDDKKYNDEDNIINEKKIALIIKSLPSEINKKYNEKLNNYRLDDEFKREIPEIHLFKSLNINYFNNFEMINQYIYHSLFNNHKINNSKSNKNFVKCLFMNELILIKLPKEISHANECIVEIGDLNNKNIFNAKYLLMFNNEEIYIHYISYIDEKIGFNSFLVGLQFNNGNSIQLYNEFNDPVGLIFNLMIESQNSNSNIYNLITKINNNINYQNNPSNNKNNNSSFNLLNNNITDKRNINLNLNNK